MYEKGESMKDILINIDFINEIVDLKGKSAGAAAAYVKEYNVIHKANTAIQHFRKNNLPIVQVKVGFSKDYRECPKNSPLFINAIKNKALQLGTWATDFHPELDVKENDFIVVKHRVSALYGTNLEPFLRANGCERVFLTGVSTDMAIQTLTRELHDRDYKVFVIEDACGAADIDVHTNSINTISRISTICKAEKISNLLTV